MEDRLPENRIADAVVEVAVRMHRRLGPGLLESVYERILAHELRKRGHVVQTQLPIPVVYDGIEIGEAFRADLLIDGLVLVELKSITRTAPVHFKQTLTYVRFARIKLGLLLNFGAPTMKDGIQRVANNL